MLSSLKTVLFSLFLAVSGNAMADVPGSVVEFLDEGGPFDDTNIRLVVFGDGQVAWYQSDASGREVFIKYVATFGTGMVGNFQALTAAASLYQVDNWQQLTTLQVSGRPTACSGQEPVRTLILRPYGGRTTIAQQFACQTRVNPSLARTNQFGTYQNEAGYEVQQLFDLMQGTRQLAARRN